MNISEISNLNEQSQAKKTEQNGSKSGFSDMLNKALSDLNDTQVKADKAVAELATGEVKDLHQAAIAIGKAETSMKLMLEIRNKAISAYKEISRTQL
ncbi:flagellar hook-basal body complex protein FliE [Campylobacter hyointestinalis]|uniref:Flagellar hook-basal body complex protein FliE n=1 Tax=Campylobacter hyointestinalis subsp. lawsonii TaxID=91353 RepID=A0AAV6ED54_CAMHY|nr:flagellar hook-basal body complex protein FliE [Campylobacter hyointestinalis]KAB0612114.1 flagellar hook-basal body complex protein FliE [Campylobacter hyointestinalis subsp. lawsonii]QKF69374.1 flagellar proximal rod protein FliE [Campylobacter hyointestinalis subsp. lawsonii]RAZ28287.1 flagellar hook-basal body complex protein FliE [Campylobacter hyointestinalis subsp. lawsonii]RAZ48425.1 flagellar hook-basal body complex protein FliE [Campylobacter hyointestinalis subsp. lawsonii]RAZ496